MDNINSEHECEKCLKTYARRNIAPIFTFSGTSSDIKQEIY